mgnify:CR=1 FL=1
MTTTGLKVTELQHLLLQLVFDNFLVAGRWPKSHRLHVEFRHLGDFWEIASSVHWHILTSGDKYQHDSEAKLSIEGISMCTGSEATLKTFMHALNSCTQFYINAVEHHEGATLTFEHLVELTGFDEQQCGIACRLLTGEPRLLSSWTGFPDGKLTDFKLSPDILRFEHIQSAADYLATLHKERAHHAKVATRIAPLINVPHDTFVLESIAEMQSMTKHIIRDAKLCTSVLQDICEIERALATQSWKTVCVLSGSACEGLLNGAITHHSKGDIGQSSRLAELIEKAIRLNIVDPRVSKLADYLRENRNLVHPSLVPHSGAVKRMHACVSFALLAAICQSLYETF